MYVLLVYSIFWEFIFPIIITHFRTFRNDKGNFLIKLCFYKYPVVKTKSNNDINNNTNNNICVYVCIHISIDISNDDLVL